MKRALLLLVFAAAGIGTGVVAVNANPHNKNTDTIPVTCEGYGNLTMTEVTRGGGNNDKGSPVVFAAYGQVFIAKSITGTSTAAFAIEGGPTLVVTDTSEQGGSGKGFADRLVQCSFSEAFEDEFVLDQGAIDYLESKSGQQLDQYLGATVHVSGVFSGVAEVVVPGSK